MSVKEIVYGIFSLTKSYYTLSLASIYEATGGIKSSIFYFRGDFFHYLGDFLIGQDALLKFS